MSSTSLDQAEDEDGLMIKPLLGENHGEYSQSGRSNTGHGYEEAITATGYGKFHYLLLALCGWALSSDAIEILCISFVLPSAACELDLSDSDKGLLNSCMFLGECLL
eukprot:GHVO01070863.1.p1 GENE.GHVO01070863.1~~GHVO01070863.1.p1  ORF type:complete len:107 (-),score=11.55 GHVO01070863.1:218-538(-)